MSRPSQLPQPPPRPGPRTRRPATVYRIRPTFDDLRPAEDPPAKPARQQATTPGPEALAATLRDLGFIGAALFVDTHPHETIWEAVLETTFEETPGHRVPRAIFRNPPGIIAWLVNQRSAPKSKSPGDMRRGSASPRSQP